MKRRPCSRRSSEHQRAACSYSSSASAWISYLTGERIHACGEERPRLEWFRPERSELRPADFLPPLWSLAILGCALSGRNWLGSPNMKKITGREEGFIPAPR